MAETSSATAKRTTWVKRLSRVIEWLSLIVGIAITVIHYFQFDVLAAVTLVPPWLWLLPALLCFLIAVRSASRPLLLATISIWLLFTGLFVEEARSLSRLSKQSVARVDSESVRIATLNCNIGSREAALETKQFAPDIVLFQESSNLSGLISIREEMYPGGSHLHGGDVSIICRGKLEPIHVDRASHFVHAVATLSSGFQCDVVSLRLSAPVFRLDFLSNGFWVDHRMTRQKHRDQIQEVVDHLKASAKTNQWIVGGDFNLVGNDGALYPLESNGVNMHDTFLESGSGWGNTGTSDYPLFRVDQIWVTNNMQSQSSRAYATENSDHRMVVTDVMLENQLSR